MAILGRKIKKGNDGTVLLGAYVPKDVSDYITLFCMAYKNTKSRLLNKIVQNWVESRKVSEPMDVILDKIIANSFETYKQDYQDRTFDDFLHDFKREVKHHVVLKVYADYVIQGVYVLYFQNEDKKNE